jgi:hypothetical protein
MTNCNEIKALIDDCRNINEKHKQELYAHIATCKQCANYKEVADSTAAILGSFHTALKQTSVDDKMLNKVKKQISKDRRKTYSGISIMVISLFSLLWFYSLGDMSLAAGVILSGWTFFGCVFSSMSARKASKFSAVSQATSSEFLVEWKKELTTEIRLTTFVASILSVEIIFFIVNLSRDNFASSQSLILLAVNAVLAIGVLYAFLIELPAIKNERLQLNDEMQ